MIRKRKTGVRGKRKFAAKFAKGNPVRLLAFRAQTSLRSNKSGPPTLSELAKRLGVTITELTPAMDILLVEKRVRAYTDASNNPLRYYPL